MKLDDIAKLKYQLENNINTQKEDEGTVEVEMERLRSLSLAPQ